MAKSMMPVFREGKMKWTKLPHFLSKTSRRRLITKVSIGLGREGHALAPYGSTSETEELEDSKNFQRSALKTSGSTV